MPLVRGEVDRLHEEIFAEVTYHAAYEPQRAVRTERWKYIRRFDDYPYPVLANCDDSESKDLLVGRGWGERRGSRASASTTSSSTPPRRENLADQPQFAGPARARCATGCERLDAGYGRPAARRPGRPAPGRADQRAVAGIGERAAARPSTRIPRSLHPADQGPAWDFGAER